MTSVQIAAIKVTTPDLILLREVAVQLAILNESRPKQLVWNEATGTWDTV